MIYLFIFSWSILLSLTFFANFECIQFGIWVNWWSAQIDGWTRAGGGRMWDVTKLFVFTVNTFTFCADNVKKICFYALLSYFLALRVMEAFIQFYSVSFGDPRGLKFLAVSHHWLSLCQGVMVVMVYSIWPELQIGASDESTDSCTHTHTDQTQAHPV